ncbi:unnamed protein product, partial [Discosporangium mesarthrocarpum]
QEPNSPVEEEPVDTGLQMPMSNTPSTNSSVESHKYSVDYQNVKHISDDERAQGTCRRGSVEVNDPTPGTAGRGDQNTPDTGVLRWPGPDPDVGGGGSTDVGGRGGIGTEDSVNRPTSLGTDTDNSNDLQDEPSSSPVPPAVRSAARQLGDFLDAPPGVTEVRAGRTRAQTRAIEKKRKTSP